MFLDFQSTYALSTTMFVEDEWLSTAQGTADLEKAVFMTVDFQLFF